MDKMDYLVEVKNLKKYFPVKGSLGSKTLSQLKAVNDVSFFIKRGETLGVVGESGCGKTTTGRSLLRLHEPTGGQVYFEGENILDLNKKELSKKRKGMQLIYQDPYSSLNPRMTVGDIISEPIIIHEKITRAESDLLSTAISRIVSTEVLEKTIPDQLPLMVTCQIQTRVFAARYPYFL
jgi:ABC-type oligopeptide transport system ATPase subunit